MQNFSAYKHASFSNCFQNQEREIRMLTHTLRADVCVVSLLRSVGGLRGLQEGMDGVWAGHVQTT